MTGTEQPTALRGAVATGDGAAVVRLLTDRPWPEDALQLIGDGLLIALRLNSPGAHELAGLCSATLRSRGREGDDELADMLQARLGTAPTRLLRPLGIDLEQLAMVLEGDPMSDGGRIDLTTGEVWPQAAIEYAEGVGQIDEEDDSDRWLRVDCQARVPATETCSGSSRTSTMASSPNVSAQRSTGAVLSARSRTPLPVGPI